MFRYQQLRDTFNAFDRDGNAEMGYNEFIEAWKFLGRSGGQAEIKKSFDSVDIDGSGLVEFSEFAFWLLGEKVLQFGLLAELEILNNLLNGVAGMLESLNSDFGDIKRRMQLVQKKMRLSEDVFNP